MKDMVSFSSRNVFFKNRGWAKIKDEWYFSLEHLWQKLDDRV